MFAFFARLAFLAGFAVSFSFALAATLFAFATALRLRDGLSLAACGGWRRGAFNRRRLAPPFCAFARPPSGQLGSGHVVLNGFLGLRCHRGLAGRSLPGAGTTLAVTGSVWDLGRDARR